VIGRKRQILVDANGLLVACRVEPAGMFDRRAARALTAGLAPLWPRIREVIADAGYESAALAQHLAENAGWELRIIKRPRPGFEIVGPNWIVERTFAWLGRHRRLSKVCEFRIQTSEALITIAACSLMLKRIAPS
jgi:putative transposase